MSRIIAASTIRRHAPDIASEATSAPGVFAGKLSSPSGHLRAASRAGLHQSRHRGGSPARHVWVSTFPGSPRASSRLVIVETDLTVAVSAHSLWRGCGCGCLAFACALSLCYRAGCPGGSGRSVVLGRPGSWSAGWYTVLILPVDIAKSAVFITASSSAHHLGRVVPFVKLKRGTRSVSRSSTLAIQLSRRWMILLSSPSST